MDARVARITFQMVMAASLTGLLVSPCSAQPTLAWDPSRDPILAAYNLCWGTNSGNYIYTNVCPATQIIATLTGLASNQVYYFAVQAVDTNGLAGPFSGEVIYTNGTSAGTTNSQGSGSPTNTNSQTASGGGGGSGSGSGSGASSNITQSLFWGVPPFLGMTLSNRHVNLIVNGTVGATLMIQSTTDSLAEPIWTTLTNVSIAQPACVSTNGSIQPQDILDVAFVPGTATVPVAAVSSAPFQYFRVFMPYDYVILADQVLLAAPGYTPRLIVINMPGIVCDDVCYVNEVSSFIHYSKTTTALQLETSTATIREIATALASSLNLDWTSASEFTCSNGMGQILATVIETEPPSSDPVAGQNPPSAPIVINF